MPDTFGHRLGLLGENAPLGQEGGAGVAEIVEAGGLGRPALRSSGTGEDEAAVVPDGLVVVWNPRFASAGARFAGCTFEEPPASFERDIVVSGVRSS